MSYLKVRKLSKSFGHLKALQEVDLDLDKGRSIAIFGDNGAGKTTLIKIISTLMNPTSGEIYVNDLDLRTNGDAIRNSLGLISHSLFLYSELNAIENLRYFGRLYGVKNLDDRIRDLLEKFGLLPRMYDAARTYSRGMLQRLTLARAVIHNPDLLLLDEPFTGLDRSASQLLRMYLEEHKTGGWFVRKLSKSFGHLKALQEVDLDLDKGRSIAIFGDNGAGKTTLIKIISTELIILF